MMLFCAQKSKFSHLRDISLGLEASFNSLCNSHSELVAAATASNEMLSGGNVVEHVRFPSLAVKNPLFFSVPFQHFGNLVKLVLK